MPETKCYLRMSLFLCSPNLDQRNLFLDLIKSNKNMQSISPPSLLLEESREMGWIHRGREEREKAIGVENQSCLHVNCSMRSAMWSLWEARVSSQKK